MLSVNYRRGPSLKSELKRRDESLHHDAPPNIPLAQAGVYSVTWSPWHVSRRSEEVGTATASDCNKKLNLEGIPAWVITGEKNTHARGVHAHTHTQAYIQSARMHKKVEGLEAAVCSSVSMMRLTHCCLATLGSTDEERRGDEGRQRHVIDHNARAHESKGGKKWGEGDTRWHQPSVYAKPFSHYCQDRES